MRILSRDFTALEKIVLLVLVLVLMGLGYYQFVDQPVRKGIAEAEAQSEQLQEKLDVVQRRLDEYYGRVEELEKERELGRMMPSYNAAEEELQIVNRVLETSEEYAVAFQDVTVDNAQVRRNFTLFFTAADFESAKGILTRLSNSSVRCLIANVECSGVEAIELFEIPIGEGENAETIVQARQVPSVVNVKADGAFYETTVGANTDPALEADRTPETA